MLKPRGKSLMRYRRPESQSISPQVINDKGKTLVSQQRKLVATLEASGPSSPSAMATTGRHVPLLWKTEDTTSLTGRSYQNDRILPVKKQEANPTERKLTNQLVCILPKCERQRTAEGWFQIKEAQELNASREPALDPGEEEKKGWQRH